MTFYVLIRGRNCEKYVRKCLKSLQNQTYGEWCALVALDNPEDNSVDVLKGFNDDRVFVVVRREHYGLGKNMYYGLVSIAEVFRPKDDDAVAIVDADDWLREDALKKAYNKYKKGALVTYGSYIKVSKGRRTRISNPYPKGANVRKYPWRMSHLKTIRWDIAKQASPKWFMKDKKWIHSASDLALMFPVAELAGLNRCVHIPDPIYYWRDNTPHKTKRKAQIKMEKYLRSQNECLV